MSDKVWQAIATESDKSDDVIWSVKHSGGTVAIVVNKHSSNGSEEETARFLAAAANACDGIRLEVLETKEMRVMTRDAYISDLVDLGH